jgi:hypothetical protein
MQCGIAAGIAAAVAPQIMIGAARGHQAGSFGRLQPALGPFALR